MRGAAALAIALTMLGGIAAAADAPVLRSAGTGAATFALYVLSAEGQAVLREHGFDAPLAAARK